MPNDIFDKMTARDVALASASANRILIELLVMSGVDRAKISDAFARNAKELLLEQHEEGAAHMMRMMAGLVTRRGG